MANAPLAVVPAQVTHGLLVIATVTAAPAAWGLELLLQWYLLPSEFGLVRTMLAPLLAPVNWGLVFVTCLCAALGVVATTRALKRIADGRGGARKRTGTFLFASSIPQVPAVVATLVTLFGGPWQAAATCLVVATVAIVHIGLRTAPDDGSV